jgi:hypothetical protein
MEFAAVQRGFLSELEEISRGQLEKQALSLPGVGAAAKKLTTSIGSAFKPKSSLASGVRVKPPPSATPTAAAVPKPVSTATPTAVATPTAAARPGAATATYAAPKAPISAARPDMATVTHAGPVQPSGAYAARAGQMNRPPAVMHPSMVEPGIAASERGAAESMRAAYGRLPGDLQAQLKQTKLVQAGMPPERAMLFASISGPRGASYAKSVEHQLGRLGKTGSVHLVAFLDEFQKLARGMNAQRRGRRPMKATTLLRKEKEGELIKHTKLGWDSNSNPPIGRVRAKTQPGDVPQRGETTDPDGGAPYGRGEQKVAFNVKRALARMYERKGLNPDGTLKYATGEGPGVNDTYNSAGSMPKPKKQKGDTPSREGNEVQSKSGDRLKWEDGHNSVTVVPGPTAQAFSSQTGATPSW